MLRWIPWVMIAIGAVGGAYFFHHTLDSDIAPTWKDRLTVCSVFIGSFGLLWNAWNSLKKDRSHAEPPSRSEGRRGR